MRFRATIVAGALFASLLALPISGARFTDTTSNEGNTFAFGTAQPIRSTTYRIECRSTICTVPLNHPLAKDYFVLLRGSAGGVDAAADYIRVAADPHGTKDLGLSGSPETLTLLRWSAATEWNGEVTVIESLSNQGTSGFTLRDVAVVEISAGRADGATPSSSSNLPRVGLYGGSMGGGMTVKPPSEGPADHASGWARVWPEAGAIHLNRTHVASTSKFTIYAVEWGSEWTIQHARVQGDNGGRRVDRPNEYDTAKLPIGVTRSQTFVLAYGTTQSASPGSGWEAQIYTLGNGHMVSTKSSRGDATENKVAVGSETGGYRDAEVYVHTHPRLSVDYEFGSMAAGQGSGSVAVNTPTATEDYINATHSTGPLRFPIFSNSYRQVSEEDPQSIAWARHTAPATLQWARSDSSNAGSYWLQSVDFGEIWR